jgi:hypothetical protein
MRDPESWRAACETEVPGAGRAARGGGEGFPWRGGERAPRQPQQMPPTGPRRLPGDRPLDTQMKRAETYYAT